MRKTLLVAVTSILAGVTGVQAQTQSFVEEHGQLSVQGTQLVDAQGEPIVLRGMSFGWHIWWPQFWNAEVVQWMKDDWHCTILRGALGIEHEGGYLKSPDSGKSLMKKVVEACIENGLYVIIDWHIIGTAILADDHTFVHRCDRLDENRSTRFEIVKCVSRCTALTVCDK